jgi:hypothetical protein
MMILNPYRFGYNSTKSFFFDGVNEFIDMGTDASLQVIDYDVAGSISVWVRFSDLSANRVIFSSISASDAFKGISLIYRNSTGRFYFSIRRLNTDNIQVESTSTTVLIDTWYNVTLTYDGTGNASGVSMYVNDSAQTISILSDTMTAVYSGVTSHHIGRNPNTSTPNYMNGYIDEVSLWNKELNSSESSEIYSGSGSGCPGKLEAHSAYNNLVSWWKMGETGSISNVPDEKGINDGAPVNMEGGDITTTVPC